MPKMISLRSFTLRSLSGHIIRVTKQQPVEIPRGILEEAMTAGMVPVDEADLPGEDAPKDALPEGSARVAAIKEKIEEFVLREHEGEKGLFSGAGSPNVVELSKELKFKITAPERDEVWAEVRKKLAEAG